MEGMEATMPQNTIPRAQVNTRRIPFLPCLHIFLPCPFDKRLLSFIVIVLFPNSQDRLDQLITPSSSNNPLLCSILPHLTTCPHPPIFHPPTTYTPHVTTLSNLPPPPKNPTHPPIAHNNTPPPITAPSHLSGAELDLRDRDRVVRFEFLPGGRDVAFHVGGGVVC
jgi:hypothetical protein